MEPIALHDGRVIQVHDSGDCIGPHCCIHNPSDTKMKDWPLNWVSGVGMMRDCVHGISHPDPDDMEARLLLVGLLDGLMMNEAIYSVHISRCDGCCMEEVPC